MTSRGLDSLEQLRAERVARAQAVLAAERAELVRHERALQGVEAQLATLREQVRARRVAGPLELTFLRAAADLNRAHTLDLRTLTAQLAQRVADCATSRERVRVAEGALVEAEVGRRAVTSVLARQAREGARRQDLAEEDAAEDAARGR